MIYVNCNADHCCGNHRIGFRQKIQNDVRQEFWINPGQIPNLNEQIRIYEAAIRVLGQNDDPVIADKIFYNSRNVSESSGNWLNRLQEPNTIIKVCNTQSNSTALANRTVVWITRTI